MNTMIVSQQQLMRRKTNDFNYFSSLNHSRNITHLNDNSSDEKKNKESEPADDLKSSTEPKAESSGLNNNSSPVRYRRTQSSTAEYSVSNRNKKSSSWFNFLPSYKVRAEEFKRHFGHIIASNERFIVDYSCAYQREILAQGRMYISLNYICFYANIFSWETNLVIKCKDIKQIYKTNTALIIPNAIEILTNSGDKYFFASYVTREKAFSMLYKIWQNALLDVKLDAKDIIETNKLAISEDLIWEWIHEAYGNYLGYTEEEERHQKSIKSSPPTKDKTVVNDSDSQSSDSDLYLDSDTFNEMNSSTRQMLESKLSDGESISCCCKEHEGSQIFNETFPLTVDQMFTLAFDDSPFYHMIQKQRKSTVLSLEQWRDLDELKDEDEMRNTERSALKKIRELKLRLQLDNALAKTVDVIEVQFLDERSVPGYFYMINSKCQNSGVPFADTFQVYTQFCFTRGSTVKECNLVVHAKVEFIKSGFGLSLMKNTIENSSMKGVADYCKFLAKHLNNWCKEKSLERRANHYQQLKQLQYDSSNEDKEDDDEDDFVLSNDHLVADDSPLIKTNSINRKVFESKARKRLKSSSLSTLNSARIQLSKINSNVSPFCRFKNNELILFVIFIILLLILVLILFLFKRLWQLEVIIRKYEEDLISFDRLVRFTSNLSSEASLKQFFTQSNATVLNLADLINQTETTIRSIKSIYLEKSSLDKLDGF